MSAPITHRCVWCLLEKAAADFNREHVIPEAFGKFENNFTLVDSVCRDCNSFFSRDLEPTLARDSLEGFHRYHYSQKPTSEFKSLGKKSVTKVQFKEGMYAGAWGYVAAGDLELRMTPFPQIGFAKNDEGPFEWYPLENLPRVEDIKAKGFVGNCYLRFCECGDMEEAQRLLKDKGFPFGETTTFDPPRGHAKMELVFWSGNLLQRRGWAKILFNYLAYTTGTATALETRFAAIRDLVLRGIEPSYEYYAMDTRAIIDGDKTDKGRHLGHIIEVHSENGEVIGTVSLYNRFRHQFRLARPPGSELTPSGHFFDWSSRTIHRLQLKGISP